MAQHNKVCQACGELGHSKFYCKKRKRKAIPRQSAKEADYQGWKEAIARPYLIAVDGNICQCCKRAARPGEKLDIEHELTKGSRPDLKRDLSNLRLYCRYPCHILKTDGIPCVH